MIILNFLILESKRVLWPLDTTTLAKLSWLLTLEICLRQWNCLKSNLLFAKNSAWASTYSIYMYRSSVMNDFGLFKMDKVWVSLFPIGLSQEEASSSNAALLHIWMTLMSLEGCWDPTQAPSVSVPTVLLKGGFDPRPTVKRSQVNQPPAYAAMTLPALHSTLKWARAWAHLLRA